MLRGFGRRTGRKFRSRETAQVSGCSRPSHANLPRMGRIFPLIVLTSLLSAFVFFSHARAQQAPQAANEAGKASAAIPIAQAHVLVTISDNQGHLISTPSKDQLVVHDNGRLVEVEEIRSAKDDPIVFSLLVDDSGPGEIATRNSSQAVPGALQYGQPWLFVTFCRQRYNERQFC